MFKLWPEKTMYYCTRVQMSSKTFPHSSGGITKIMPHILLTKDKPHLKYKEKILSHLDKWYNAISCNGLQQTGCTSETL